uniref:Uncharacterized protein n=1 Tax=Pithovirus LCPAC404 TaxID=2506597 RepID=A0A481ZEJ6_9VIRU|nr:MAG: hypothetical protein LCPAC404_02340 [Pithovirus LCPAC404]
MDQEDTVLMKNSIVTVKAAKMILCADLTDAKTNPHMVRNKGFLPGAKLRNIEKREW